MCGEAARVDAAPNLGSMRGDCAALLKWPANICREPFADGLLGGGLPGGAAWRVGLWPVNGSGECAAVGEWALERDGTTACRRAATVAVENACPLTCPSDRGGCVGDAAGDGKPTLPANVPRLDFAGLEAVAKIILLGLNGVDGSDGELARGPTAPTTLARASDGLGTMMWFSAAIAGPASAIAEAVDHSHAGEQGPKPPIGAAKPAPGGKSSDLPRPRFR
mmetsp:Transcript_69167/g.192559  ORF Transcript_69167/g.192559 Transcript_69167/m.192559 type:complete len:221 (-) Transcript_69167:694-1356(-)